VLNGTWRLHPGDDARWADPGFDDSSWPVLKRTDRGSSQGYPALSSFAWYRDRLLVPDPAPPEMLRIPAAALCTNCQVFADRKQGAPFLVRVYKSSPPGRKTGFS
jgi:hypothetical protein